MFGMMFMHLGVSLALLFMAGGLMDQTPTALAAATLTLSVVNACFAAVRCVAEIV